MKVLFVHSNKFIKKDGLIYDSYGSFPHTIWSRYTEVFDNLTVVGRDGFDIADKINKLTLSSAKKVDFVLLPNNANLKSFILGNEIINEAAKRLISEHDALIARVPSEMSSIFIEEAIEQSKPYALEVVGCPWDALWNYGNIQGKLLAPYSTLKLKFQLKRAKYVIYVTERFLQSRYPHHKYAITEYASNVELPSVSEEILTSRLEKISDLNESKTITFGLIGNYSSKYKGIDTAIKALAIAKLPKWRFEILGSGDPSSYIQLAGKLKVRDKVFFVGSLPSGDQVFKWLDNIDVYLHPSRQEGLPRAVIEALSRGCPTLATNIAGIPELLNPTEMINVKDHVSLANKINALLNEKGRLTKLAIENFNKAKEYYKNILDKRRINFWQKFRNLIITK